MTPEFRPNLLNHKNKNKSSKYLDLEKWGISSNRTQNDLNKECINDIDKKEN